MDTTPALHIAIPVSAACRMTTAFLCLSNTRLAVTPGPDLPSGDISRAAIVSFGILTYSSPESYGTCLALRTQDLYDIMKDLFSSRCKRRRVVAASLRLLALIPSHTIEREAASAILECENSASSPIVLGAASFCDTKDHCFLLSCNMRDSGR